MINEKCKVNIVMTANEVPGKEKHTKKERPFHAECDDIIDGK